MKVLFNNDKARRNWLNHYAAWGVWFRVPQTGATWYRCYLPDGAMLAVEQYSDVERHTGYCKWTSHTVHYYMIKPGEQFDGQIETEGALMGEIHGLRGEVEIRCSED